MRPHRAAYASPRHSSRVEPRIDRRGRPGRECACRNLFTTVGPRRVCHRGRTDPASGCAGRAHRYSAGLAYRNRPARHPGWTSRLPGEARRVYCGGVRRVAGGVARVRSRRHDGFQSARTPAPGTGPFPDSLRPHRDAKPRAQRFCRLATADSGMETKSRFRRRRIVRPRVSPLGPAALAAGRANRVRLRQPLVPFQRRRRRHARAAIRKRAGGTDRGVDGWIGDGSDRNYGGGGHARRRPFRSNSRTSRRPPGRMSRWGPCFETPIPPACSVGRTC